MIAAASYKQGIFLILSFSTIISTWLKLSGSNNLPSLEILSHPFPSWSIVNQASSSLECTLQRYSGSISFISFFLVPLSSSPLTYLNSLITASLPSVSSLLQLIPFLMYKSNYITPLLRNYFPLPTYKVNLKLFIMMQNVLHKLTPIFLLRIIINRLPFLYVASLRHMWNYGMIFGLFHFSPLIANLFCWLWISSLSITFLLLWHPSLTLNPWSKFSSLKELPRFS